MLYSTPLFVSPHVSEIARPSEPFPTPTSISSHSARWILPVPVLLFFGSGACALVYQVLWLWPLVEYFLSLPRDRDVDLSSLRGDSRRHVLE